jgi:DNA-binding CsgD family transcriptional regulator
MITKNTTWINYFKELNDKNIVPDQMMIREVKKFSSINQQAFNILNHSVPMVYLLDYTTGKYAFVSRQCQALSLPYEKMMAGGVDFVLERYHEGDLRLFNEQIFPDRLKMLKEIPAEEHKDHIFSFSYRIKNGKGEYVNLIQRNSFIQSDENGNPLLSLGVVTNIDHFKEPNPVIQLLEKVDSETGSVELVAKNTYYLNEEHKTFTKREKEILLYLADGLTSRQIADKLFLSEHTIINHKRNMHHKSNTQNTAALINFAFSQHLL